MRQSYQIAMRLIVISIAALLSPGILPAQDEPEVVDFLDPENRIEIVAEATNFARRWNLDELSHESADGKTVLTNKPTKQDAWEIEGIVMRIKRPEKFKGMVYTMHHDGMLASGDPTKMFPLNKEIRLMVMPSDIGRFDFRECSLTPLALINRSEKKKNPNRVPGE